ncbi:energy-coupling factor transporter transmembrane component T [Modestobacter sp. VKM Ac-2984]|uniref:energy-coupling factor transporter transmembrane component T n=1 Tax=Modestobacter sp. VKM Ac-2984 TaxID=3004138 RepID=UPI0022AAA21A|nr:energy-coupling factor transporter transmembrane component T [Modestobacter sp. VKM Ac-2984]MCZ2815098.1 energy-coupling factor transporter transmembrane component T [Modestobacter sp. VKM Ac-2984]
MPSRVPVLYRDHDTVVHRRDPRVKVLLLGLLFVFIFVAPSAQWMSLAVLGGLLLAVLARTPWRWLVVLWAIHIPTFVALILIGGWGSVTSGDWAGVIDAGGAHLRLVLAWTGAILVSVSLFSTIDPDDLSRGLRGVGLPAAAAFGLGLAYRLLYTTLTETASIAETMRLRGLRLEWRRPIRFIAESVQVSLPVLFNVVRRGPMLMSTMQIRGYSQDAQLGRLRVADVAVLAIGVAVVVGSAVARWGPLPTTLI